MKNLYLDKSEAKKDKRADLVARMVCDHFRTKLMNELRKYLASEDIIGYVKAELKHKQDQLEQDRIEAQLQLEANNERRVD